MAAASHLLKVPASLHDGPPLLLALGRLLLDGHDQAARVVLRTVDAAACDSYWRESAAEGLRRHSEEAHAGRIPVPRKAVPRSWKLEIGERDGWRCRYCGLRVAAPGFFRAVAQLLPDEFPGKGTPIAETMWPIYRAYDSSPDHVHPVSAGGAHSIDNLVTACGACNYQAKGHCTLEELGLAPPGPPRAADGWDGLRPIIPALESLARERTAPGP